MVKVIFTWIMPAKLQIKYSNVGQVEKAFWEYIVQFTAEDRLPPKRDATEPNIAPGPLKVQRWRSP